MNDIPVSYTHLLILGAGNMGSFFTDILSFQHETAVFDVNPHQLRFVYNTYRFTTLEEIKEFEPELVINAVTVKYTLDAFRKVLPIIFIREFGIRIRGYLDSFFMQEFYNGRKSYVKFSGYFT